jgi:hypothetical protein
MLDAGKQGFGPIDAKFPIYRLKNINIYKIHKVVAIFIGFMIALSIKFTTPFLRYVWQTRTIDISFLNN